MSEAIASVPEEAGSAEPAPRDGSAPQPSNERAIRFAVTAVVLGLALFGLFRVPWVQTELLVPYAEAQQRLAGWIAGYEKLPVVVSFACTGADVMALCLATVLAFPAPWRRRLWGAAVGLLLISAVNTVRIGSLSLVAGRKELFDTLHVVVWPAILIVVVSLYVFLWMSRAGRARGRSEASAPADRSRDRRDRSTALRFALWLIPLTVLYLATSGWYLNADWVLAATRWTASAAAALMSLVGAAPRVTGNVLATVNGSFRVTPTCIATPLVPVYFAAALALPMSLGRRFAFLLAGPLVFLALGVLRLLVLALPQTLVPSYEDAIHAFNSLLFALLLVVLAAVWRGRSGRATAAAIARLAGSALLIGAAVALALGIPWTRLLGATSRSLLAASGHAGHWFADTQSATSLLPSFQLGLFGALLWTLAPDLRRIRLRVALVAILLGALQLATWVALAELWSHGRFEPHVRDQRAWMIVLPVLLAWWASGRGVRELRRKSSSLPAGAAAGAASGDAQVERG